MDQKHREGLDILFSKKMQNNNNSNKYNKAKKQNYDKMTTQSIYRTYSQPR